LALASCHSLVADDAVRPRNAVRYLRTRLLGSGLPLKSVCLTNALFFTTAPIFTHAHLRRGGPERHTGGARLPVARAAAKQLPAAPIRQCLLRDSLPALPQVLRPAPSASSASRPWSSWTSGTPFPLCVCGVCVAAWADRVVFRAFDSSSNSCRTMAGRSQAPAKPTPPSEGCPTPPLPLRRSRARRPSRS
jgi:hypothetical protein